jgi:hypothetical protein
MHSQEWRHSALHEFFIRSRFDKEAEAGPGGPAGPCKKQHYPFLVTFVHLQ